MPVTETWQVIFTPPIEVEEHNQLFAFAFTIDTKNGTIYTDFTGKFPVRSLDGMVTVFVLYDWTSNAILADPMAAKHPMRVLPAPPLLRLNPKP